MKCTFCGFIMIIKSIFLFIRIYETLFKYYLQYASIIIIFIKKKKINYYYQHNIIVFNRVSKLMK